MVSSTNLRSLANHLVAYSGTLTFAQNSTNPDQQNSMIAFSVSFRGRWQTILQHRGCWNNWLPLQSQ
jgi:hypothetical protein